MNEWQAQGQLWMPINTKGYSSQSCWAQQSRTNLVDFPSTLRQTLSLIRIGAPHEQTEANRPGESEDEKSE